MTKAQKITYAEQYYQLLSQENVLDF